MLETRNTEIETLMCAPDICTNVEKLQELDREKTENEKELVGLYERWEELSLEE